MIIWKYPFNIRLQTHEILIAVASCILVFKIQEHKRDDPDNKEKNKKKIK